MEQLLTLPGVARKTANVVLGTAFGIALRGRRGYARDPALRAPRSFSQYRSQENRAGLDAGDSAGQMDSVFPPVDLARAQGLPGAQAEMHRMQSRTLSATQKTRPSEGFPFRGTGLLGLWTPCAPLGIVSTCNSCRGKPRRHASQGSSIRSIRFTDFPFISRRETISSLDPTGQIDFGGGEYVAAGRMEIAPQQLRLEDKYLWWDLGHGSYFVECNETLHLAPRRNRPDRARGPAVARGRVARALVRARAHRRRWSCCWTSVRHGCASRRMRGSRVSGCSALPGARNQFVALEQLKPQKPKRTERKKAARR